MEKSKQNDSTETRVLRKEASTVLSIVVGFHKGEESFERAG
jgi:hypothetical protein